MTTFYVEEYRKPSEEAIPVGSFILSTDPWDDYGFETKFHMYYKKSLNAKVLIGEVKIGFKGQRSKLDLDNAAGKIYGHSTKKVIDKKFDSINKNFFSIGQSPEYYENIYKIFNDETARILGYLNDIALHTNFLELYKDESVLKNSLLRSQDEWSIKYQFNQIIYGREKLTDFHFLFNYKEKDLNFKVKALSNPPSNIHALIGRNGVGKTTILNGMFDELINKNGNGKFKAFRITDSIDTNYFSKAIYISYSVFGSYLPDLKDRDNMSYIGFKYKKDEEIFIKNIDILNEDFIDSFKLIRSSTSLKKTFVKILKDISESYDNDIIQKLNINIEDSKNNDFNFFKDLSSGHAIVLLIIANLISTVTEKTLILFDEPETHLHPPLLSALIRAINFILIEKNGICIFATHSPVVSQEIPQSCVQIISRVGDEISISRPEIESFGENVSSLTHEIFSLEVKSSGFYKLLRKTFYENNCNVEKVIEIFDNKLGSEALGLLYLLKHNYIKNDKKTD